MPVRRRSAVLTVVTTLATAVLLHVPTAVAAPCTQADPVVRHHCELGGVTGFLGAPTTAVLPAPDRVGRFQYYAGGAIYWSPSTGAHEVHGAILATWASMGWERSLLGYPVTDELTAPDGVGRGSFFRGGVVYWTPATGAHEVHGAILAEWRSMGWERSLLGYPVTDELTAPDGVGRGSFFQGGVVYWTPATGAHEVHGAILAAWRSMGWERSALGYPITDEYGVNAGRQSDFQGGFLRWTEATGTVRTAVLGPYDRSGTWVSRFGFSREFAGPNPPIPPSSVDAMAAAGVDTVYLQAAADDPRFPGPAQPGPAR